MEKVNVVIEWENGYGDVLFLDEATEECLKACCERIGYNFDSIVKWWEA